MAWHGRAGGGRGHHGAGVGGEKLLEFLSISDVPSLITAEPEAKSTCLRALQQLRAKLKSSKGTTESLQGIPGVGGSGVTAELKFELRGDSLRFGFLRGIVIVRRPQATPPYS